MLCPKCENRLHKVKMTIRPEYGADILHDAEQTNEIEVDQCLSCNGVWFDVKELDQYLAEKLLILSSPQAGRYQELNKKDGPCPKCHQPMVKRAAPKKAPFKIDVCEKCMGVWLDSSEIDKLEEKNFSWGEKHALVFRNFKELFLTK